MPFDGRSFDVKKYSRFAPVGNLDEGENLFLKRELLFKLPKMLEVVHELIRARQLFPINRSVPPGALEYGFEQEEDFGEAKIIADYSEDIPSAESRTEEKTLKIRSIAEKAVWSVQEIRSSSMANRPLSERKTRAARKGMLRKENKIAFTGDTKHDLVGLLSGNATTGIPEVAAPNGSWTMALAAASILEDMFFTSKTVVEQSGGNYAANTLVMPFEKYHIIAQRKHGTDTDVTILQHFLRNDPYIREVVPAMEMKSANHSLGSDVMVAYQRDPDVLELITPLDIFQHAPQRKNLAVEVIYEMRTGGLSIYKPLACHVVTGL